MAKLKEKLKNQSKTIKARRIHCKKPRRSRVSHEKQENYEFSISLRHISAKLPL